MRLASLEGENYAVLSDPNLMIKGLRKAHIRIDVFTFMQQLPEMSPKYAYPMEWDNLAALRVTTFDHWWAKQIDNKTRNMVRKAERKGVVLKEVPFDVELVRGIWEVYNECPVRQAGPFKHYGTDIPTVHRLEATFLDKSIFVGAFLDGKMIGFAKLICDETHTQAHLVNIVSMICHRDKAPTNALLGHAVQACASRGIGWLIYAKFAYGKKQRSSLSDFKKNNGFERIDLPRYYVPLTRFGSAAFRLGLHHRFVEHLPESVLSTVRELRRAWYGRKLRNPAEAS